MARFTCMWKAKDLRLYVTACRVATYSYLQEFKLLQTVQKSCIGINIAACKSAFAA